MIASSPPALVVRRGDGTVQVGGDGTISLVADDPGGRIHARLIDRPDVGSGEGVPRIGPAGTVRVVGQGSLAAAVAALLGPAASVDVVAETNAALRTPWTPSSPAPAPLTVIASDTVEPDRMLPERLLRRDLPHLVVRPLPYGAVVGPFVVPGRSACLHCTDLTRRDADPAWPAVLQASAQLVVEPDPVASAWAVAYAAGQMLAYAAGVVPETLGSTVELSAPDYRLRWRAWPAHPDCGCWW